MDFRILGYQHLGTRVSTCGGGNCNKRLWRLGKRVCREKERIKYELNVVPLGSWHCNSSFIRNSFLKNLEHSGTKQKKPEIHFKTWRQ